MNYSSYIQQLRSSSVSINGKDYSSQDVLEWSQEETADDYLIKVKKVYEKWFNESDSFEITTSGSTGEPKLIKLSKEKMYNSAKSSLAYFKLTRGDKVLLVLPADKVGGTMLIIRSIIGNLNLFHRKPSLTPFINYWEENYQFCSLTPAQMNASIARGMDKELVNIEKILLGGSALDQELQSYIDRQKNLYFSSYGMTETISHVAIQHLNGVHRSDYYNAIGNVTFRQNNDKCLIISAPSIVDQELLTNDIVELLSATKMRWLGRFDNIVNSGGIKLIPEKIEQKIANAIPYEFYLTSEQDHVLGEQLVMVIKAENITKVEVNKLVDEVSQLLEKLERPKIVYVGKELNYTKNRKLIRSKPNQLSVMGYKFS